jgi:CO/xanthine dehydrogenase FAD-binding subunit
MDLDTVRSLRVARQRSDLVLAPGEALLAGGTWLFSEPQPAVTGLVDLSALGWEPCAETADGLSIAATCTLADLRRHADAARWPAAPLIVSCIDALLMSFKVQNTATVGGNLCLALPAGAMISLAVGLGGDVVIWAADGAERTEAVSDFVTGSGTTTLVAGEVLRSVHVPAAALRARTAFRKMALTALGRSAAVVIGRLDEEGRCTITVSAATPRPVVLAFASVPAPDELGAALDGIGSWYADAHGAADWRAAVTRVLADEVVAELAP